MNVLRYFNFLILKYLGYTEFLSLEQNFNFIHILFQSLNVDTALIGLVWSRLHNEYKFALHTSPYLHLPQLAHFRPLVRSNETSGGGWWWWWQPTLV